MTAENKSHAAVIEKRSASAKKISNFLGAGLFRMVNPKIVLFLIVLLWGGAYLLEMYRDTLVGKAFYVKVEHIVDGDTFVATIPSITQFFSPMKARFRLRGVDAPELDQPYGREAMHALSSLLTPPNGFNADYEIVCRVLGKDDWGRFIVDVLIRHGFYTYARNVQRELVIQGAAWAFPSFSGKKSSPGEQSLEELMATAKESKAGLWGLAARLQQEAVAPWIHRRQQREARSLKKGGSKEEFDASGWKAFGAKRDGRKHKGHSMR